LKNGGPIHSNLKTLEYFSDESEFETKINNIIDKMLKTNTDHMHLLIISVHGEQNTGTNLSLTNGKSINLRLYQKIFKKLPEKLFVYISACWGAYPSQIRIFYQKNTDTKGVIIQLRFSRSIFYRI